MKSGPALTPSAAGAGALLGMADIFPPTAPLLHLGSRVTGAPVNGMMKPAPVMNPCTWRPARMVRAHAPFVALRLPDRLFD